jgi:peptide subunit release factor 1 (eRF1)
MGAPVIADQALNQLIDFRADGSPVVSLYATVPVDPRERQGLRARVNSLLDELDPMAEDQSLGREARLSIRDDIARLRTAVQEEHWKPHGIGLFACSARNFFEEVELPAEPQNRVLVDATPWVRPIAAMRHKAHRACVVTLDRGHAVFWELQGDELTPIDELQDEVLRNDDATGGRWGGREWATHYEARELAKHHFRHVVERLDRLFFPEHDPDVQYRTVVEDRSEQEVGADRRYDVLVVAEHGDETSGFLDELPDQLRQKLAGTFTDPSLDDRGALKGRLVEVLDRWERDQERQGVQHVLEIEAMGGWGVTGLHKCLWAASAKAIETLFLRREDEFAGVICDACGWLGESGGTCPVSGDPLRHTPDVVDELLESVLRNGGEVRTLADDIAPEGRTPLAHLRFPLPPEPAG